MLLKATTPVHLIPGLQGVDVFMRVNNAAASSDKDKEEGSAFRSLSHFSCKVSSAFVIQISFSRARATFFSPLFEKSFEYQILFPIQNPESVIRQFLK